MKRVWSLVYAMVGLALGVAIYFITVVFVRLVTWVRR